MKSYVPILAVVIGACFTVTETRGAAVDPFYGSAYELLNLGALPEEVPEPYGGLTLKHGDENTLLIGGQANSQSGRIYAVTVTRDAENHITGFAGTPTVFADAPGGANGGIDGGLAYGPGGVLFYTSYGDNYLGQIKPGSTSPDKLTNLSTLGIGSSVGSINFPPPGFPGAGQAKIVAYVQSDWYSVTLEPDGNGTYDIESVGPPVSLGSGRDLEGVTFVPAGNPLFLKDSILISRYKSGRVDAYEVDSNGDPIPASMRSFVTGLTGAEGAYTDPLTGDFLFSTFSWSGKNEVAVVRGFIPIPEPSTAILIWSLLGTIGITCYWKRRSR